MLNTGADGWGRCMPKDEAEKETMEALKKGRNG